MIYENEKISLLFIFAFCAVLAEASDIIGIKKEALNATATWLKIAPATLEDSKRAEQFFIDKIGFDRCENEALIVLNALFKNPPCNIKIDIKTDSEHELTVSIHYSKKGVGRFSIFYFMVFDEKHQIQHVKDGYGFFRFPAGRQKTSCLAF